MPSEKLFKAFEELVESEKKLELWTKPVKRKIKVNPYRYPVIALEKEMPKVFLSIRKLWNEHLQKQVDAIINDIKEKNDLKTKTEAIALVLKALGYQIKDPRHRPVFARERINALNDWEATLG